MPRRQRRWLRPAAIEREYAALLVSWADEVNAAVAAKFDAFRTDAVEDIPESAGWQETVRLAFLSAAALLSSARITYRIAEFSRRAAEFNHRQFHAVLRSVYGIDLFVAEPWLADVLKAWEAENIGLIRSIPSRALESMHGQVVAALRRGATRREVSEALRHQYGVTRSRARLIARDQIGKLNGQLTQERQTSIGVEAYIWRGMLDERERDSHVAREGKRFLWSEPPPDGHPSYAIQCRCSAEAELPLLQDLKGVQFSLPLRRAQLSKGSIQHGIR
jgi:SPP1 gp7 family putative phage head morphogenesis protein